MSNQSKVRQNNFVPSNCSSKSHFVQPHLPCQPCQPCKLCKCQRCQLSGPLSPNVVLDESLLTFIRHRIKSKFQKVKTHKTQSICTNHSLGFPTLHILFSKHQYNPPTLASGLSEYYVPRFISLVFSWEYQLICMCFVSGSSMKRNLLHIRFMQDLASSLPLFDFQAP